MKRLISATLALSLLGATAASAAPAYRDTPIAYRDGRADNGAAIAVGVGFLALLAIMASQDHQRAYDRDGRQYHDGDRGYQNFRGGHDRGYGFQDGRGR
jgi:hypothetical protein